MIVTMEDRLAGDLADIYTDVEAFNTRVPSDNLISKPAQKAFDRLSLGFTEIEERSHVPLEQYEAVQMRHQRGVTNGKCEIVLCNDLLPRDGAEDATGDLLLARHGALHFERATRMDAAMIALVHVPR